MILHGFISPNILYCKRVHMPQGGETVGERMLDLEPRKLSAQVQGLPFHSYVPSWHLLICRNLMQKKMYIILVHVSHGYWLICLFNQLIFSKPPLCVKPCYKYGDNKTEQIRNLCLHAACILVYLLTIRVKCKYVKYMCIAKQHT